MTLTAKQKAAVAKAQPAAKAAVRAGYEKQNMMNRRPPQPQPKRAVRGPPPTRKTPGVVKATPKLTIKNFLDPLSAQPAPTIVSEGKALPHTSLTSHDFTVGSGKTTVLIVTNTGDSGTVGIVFNVNSEGKFIDGMELLTIPTLALADSAGGPSASRAMKLSATVVNCSNALKRGGRVTYINSSQRLPAMSTVVDKAYGPILTGIKSSPYRRRITGDLLADPKQLISYPVDTATYLQFKPHHGTLNGDEFFEYVLGASATNEPKSRPMSIIAYVFEPTADVQDYSVTIRASYYTRWPLTTVPGQSMRPIPTAAPAHVNHVHDHAEETANDLIHVVEGGALATAAPKVMGKIGSMISRGLGSVAQAVETQAVNAVERGVESTVLGAVESGELAPLLLL